MTSVAMIQNEFEWQIRGQADISAAAAVTATRGTNQVAARTGVGTYTVTVKDTGLKLVEVLNQRVSWVGAVPTAALGCRITGITQNTAGDIVIAITTMANPTSGAATDNTTTTPTLDWDVVIRTGKMGNPL